MKTIVAVLCAAALPAAAVAGCGGVPGNAVATIDGEPITKKDFDHWMAVAAKSSGQPTASVPDPPAFAKCVASKKKTQPKPAKGQPAPTDAQLKQQCDQEHKALRDQVLQILISFRWLEGQAEQMGIKVSDSEVQKSFDQQKKQAFPKEKDFQKFLSDSGQSLEDIMLRVKVDQLSNKIREKVTKGKDKVTDAQVKDYYDKNKQRFAQPERRDLRIVLTKTQAKAAEAKRAIDGGQSFKSVAKKLSIDQASKSQGGKLPGVAKGQQEKALDEAVFNAKKGRLTGPVKTQFGFYVFEVTKVAPASQQSLAQATPTIKQLLAAQNQQKALDTFVKDFRKDWKDKTECRKGYVTQDCKNAPKPKPSPTSTSGSTAPAPAPTQSGD